MFFKKKEKENINTDLIKICALLIHAAKIDEHFSKKEEEIIKQAMLRIGAKSDDLDKLFHDAKRRLRLLKHFGELYTRIKRPMCMRQI